MNLQHSSPLRGKSIQFHISYEIQYMHFMRVLLTLYFCLAVAVLCPCRSLHNFAKMVVLYNLTTTSEIVHSLLVKGVNQHNLVPRPLPVFQYYTHVTLNVTLKNWEWPGDKAKSTFNAQIMWDLGNRTGVYTYVLINH